MANKIDVRNFELRLKYKAETSRTPNLNMYWRRNEDGDDIHVLDDSESVLEYVAWLEEKLMELLTK